ncbi:MAG: DNRLRE domain-containing protein [Methylohalobius sp. ZOD2]
MKKQAADLIRGVLGLLLVLESGGVWADQVVLPASKDNTMYEGSGGALANGRGDGLFVGRTDAGLLRRALIAFDVAGRIPPGSTINSATLTLEMTRERPGSPATEVTLHKLQTDWGEGTSDAPAEEGAGTPATPGDATVEHAFFDFIPWDNPRGDFEFTLSASVSVQGLGSFTWTSVQMTTDVQTWLDDPSLNHGWILIGDEGGFGTAKRFASRENTIAPTPALTVDFTPPASGNLALAVTANQEAFAPGNTLRLSLAASNPVAPVDGDVFLAILLPDGDTLNFFSDLSPEVEVASISQLANVSPLISFSFPASFFVTIPDFYTNTWVGDELAGQYIVYLVVTSPGAFSDGTIDPGDILALDSVTFTFHP